MQKMMVKSGKRYRAATPAEVAEVAGFYAREEFNRTRPDLSSPRAAVEYLMRIYAGRDHETFAVLFTDARSRLIECVEMFRGTVNASAVHPREVVKEALWRGAVGVVFAHNHPSGHAEPSQADELITRRLREALALIEVRVLDHLIIGGRGTWYSFAEHGLL